MIRIDGARVFDGERVLDGMSVYVEDGLVTEVTRTADIDAADMERVAEVVDASGHTLLPGLIDAHTHVMGTLHNLRLALTFGVTTELDMFSFPAELTAWLCTSAGEHDDLADLRSSGTVVCPTGGHPVASMPYIPSLAGPQDAEEYVLTRRKEGAHYIKLMFDDGCHHGAELPTLDAATATAVTEAARAAGLFTVAHVADAATVRDALDAGVDAVTHLPLDAPLPLELVNQAAAEGRVFIPTLAMMEMSSGAAEGRALADDERIAAHLPADIGAAVRHGREGLAVTVPHPGLDFAHALATTRHLHRAGVQLLAGTDANNAPGRACPVVHGAALHRELELLVVAGLTPSEALTAATASPARHFGLHDRGRIAPGLRADLILVEGDPTRDITATRAIRRIWRRGVPFHRETQRTTGPQTPQMTQADGGHRTAGEPRPGTPADAAADGALTAVGTTALAVASARALESTRPDRLFDDQIAVQTVAAAGTQLAAWSSSRGELMRLAMGDYFALRTRYFDDSLREAVESGCRQVVVLAAGLDARAFRLHWPAPVRLFELDRPDIFSFKDRIITGRVPTPDCTRTAVVADLRKDWPSALRAQGFDPTRPTAWLAEGIMVYLTEREGEDLLTRIGTLSAPSSRLTLEYGSLAMFHTEQTSAALAHTSDDDVLHTLAALWRNESTEDPALRLARHGWTTVSQDAADLARTYGRPVPPAFDPTLPGTGRISLISGIRT